MSIKFYKAICCLSKNKNLVRKLSFLGLMLWGCDCMAAPWQTHFHNLINSTGGFLKMGVFITALVFVVIALANGAIKVAFYIVVLGVLFYLWMKYF